MAMAHHARGDRGVSDHGTCSQAMRLRGLGNAYSCPACRRWWSAHRVLHDGLGLPPWQFPAFADPDMRERAEHPDRDDLYAALVEAANVHSSRSGN